MTRYSPARTERRRHGPADIDRWLTPTPGWTRRGNALVNVHGARIEVDPLGAEGWHLNAYRANGEVLASKADSPQPRRYGRLKRAIEAIEEADGVRTNAAHELDAVIATALARIDTLGLTAVAKACGVSASDVQHWYNLNGQSEGVVFLKRLLTAEPTPEAIAADTVRALHMRQKPPVASDPKVIAQTNEKIGDVLGLHFAEMTPRQISDEVGMLPMLVESILRQHGFTPRMAGKKA